MQRPFQNTAVGFDYKSVSQLKKARFLFLALKHFPRTSIALAWLGYYALKGRLPFTRSLIRNIFFEHFCGGETIEGCAPVIRKLSLYNVATALDFGVEGKNTAQEHLMMVNEIVETIIHVREEPEVPVIPIKLTAIASFELLEKYSHDKTTLSSEEKAQIQRLRERLDLICTTAMRANKTIYLDAEESWIQPALDDLALEMMVKFNKQRAVLFNTYQLYLKSSFDRLKTHRELCIAQGSFFAAKLVRGAYMEKENLRARKLGYETPVQPAKIMTDMAYNDAMMYCLLHHKDTFFCLATHNTESSWKMVNTIKEDRTPTDHIHFCQLYGMSDPITFALAKEGFFAMKYVPFGKIEDTYPYMIRRAEENSGLTGSTHQELQWVTEELNRRKSGISSSPHKGHIQTSSS
ncbi:proline dehydrogenase family protein [Fulvivirga ulvae]|uniref:proline dehydrogenase family protein n=1 Tax=Fulvivirga ulvae TaxID=2904245 RepID=UPI001F39BBE4|nr:proline dehydrogenase family protein [Fulvivirga ulvae]UII31829.1 proline dehydrogenase family protein [Fulvivirga ulvae]